MADARHRLPRLTCSMPALLTVLALTSCGWVTPTPMTAIEQAERAHLDHETLLKDRLPLTEPLSLEVAIARALKYNYASELSRLENTLQERQVDLATMSMLPQLAANAGYSWRNNYDAVRSINVITGRQSLDYSYTEEPQRTFVSLQFFWNAVDFGVSYFQARQQAYRALIAVERRRKVIDNIVKCVQEIYWKAAVAQTLLPKLEPLMEMTRQQLDASRLVPDQRPITLARTLDHQRELLQIISQLRHMRNDLAMAHLRLATMINVPIDSPIRITADPDLMLHDPVALDVPALEETSLSLRPELREAAYQEKIDRQGVYQEIIKMLPGIGLLGSFNYDGNRLLYDGVWGEMGIQATYNLFNLVEGPKAIMAARSAVEVAQVRRLALAVAVLTQVNLSVQEYRNAVEELTASTQMDVLQHRLLTATAGAALPSDIARIHREVDAITADFERGRALGDAYTALANLYIATGKDLVAPDVDVGDLGKLSRIVQVAVAPWARGEMPLTPADQTPVLHAAAENPVETKPTRSSAVLPMPGRVRLATTVRPNE